MFDCRWANLIHVKAHHTGDSRNASIRGTFHHAVGIFERGLRLSGGMKLHFLSLH